MEIEITDWSANIEREPELCSFLLLDEDPRCVLCEQRLIHGMNQFHAGPVAKISGWLETGELYGPEFLGHEVTLPYHNRNDQIAPDVPVVITGCLPSNNAMYRYSFYGQKDVGVDKVTKDTA